MRLVAACVGGKVDVPLIVKAVDFRRPDLMTVRAGCRRGPDNTLLSVGKISNVWRGPEREIMAGRGHEIVDALVIHHPRIGAGRKQRVRESVGLRRSRLLRGDVNSRTKKDQKSR